MGRLSDAFAVLNGERTARPRARRKDVPFGRRVTEAARVLGRGDMAVRWTNTDARLGSVREASDPDDGLSYSAGGARFFRKITQTSADLPAYEFATMLKVARHLYRSSPLARRIVELRTNYVLGDGVRITAVHPDVQAVIDAFLGDPFNQFDRRIHGLVNAWRVDGELILPITRNRIDGKIRFGYVSPDRVAECVPSPTNVADVVAIRLKDSVDEQGKPVTGPVLRTIRLVERPDDPAFGHFEGDVFYIPANRLPDMTRGLSDLWTIADYIAAHEETIWSLAEGAAIRNAFVLHVVYKGLDEDELAERFDTTNPLPPTPGEMIATNESVEYKFLTPTFGANDAGAWTDIILSVIATGADMPPWVLGKQDDPNRASAAEFSGPMVRGLKELQREAGAWIEDVVGVVVDAATLIPGMIAPDADLGFSVILPDLDAKDVTAAAASFQTGSAAVVGVRDAGLLDTTTSIDAVAVLVERLGVDVDGGTIRERLAAEQAEDLIAANMADHMIHGTSDPYAGTTAPAPDLGPLGPPAPAGPGQSNANVADDALGRPADAAEAFLGANGTIIAAAPEVEAARATMRQGALARAGTQAAKCPTCGARGAPNLACRGCGNRIPSDALIWDPDDVQEAVDPWAAMPGAQALVPGDDGRFVVRESAPPEVDREALIAGVLEDLTAALGAGTGAATEAAPAGAWPDRRDRARRARGA